MLTMQELKAHALSKLNHPFPLGDCEECLAADLTGRIMAGHAEFVGGEKVPPALASFTRGVCSARMHPEADPNDPDKQGTLTGAEIAAALEKIEQGEDPYLAGTHAWLTRAH